MYANCVFCVSIQLDDTSERVEIKPEKVNSVNSC